MSWFDDAPCKGLANIFYPTSDSDKAATPAKAICEKCKFIEICLKFSIENKEDHGIWGGLTARERRAYVRRVKRAEKASQ